MLLTEFTHLSVVENVFTISESRQLITHGQRTNKVIGGSGQWIDADHKLYAQPRQDRKCPPHCIPKRNINLIQSAFGAQLQNSQDGSWLRSHLLYIRLVERLRYVIYGRGITVLTVYGSRLVVWEWGLPRPNLHISSVFMTRLVSSSVSFRFLSKCVSRAQTSISLNTEAFMPINLLLFGFIIQGLHI